MFLCHTVQYVNYILVLDYKLDKKSNLKMPTWTLGNCEDFKICYSPIYIILSSPLQLKNTLLLQTLHKQSQLFRESLKHSFPWPLRLWPGQTEHITPAGTSYQETIRTLGVWIQWCGVDCQSLSAGPSPVWGHRRRHRRCSASAQCCSSPCTLLRSPCMIDLHHMIDR